MNKIYHGDCLEEFKKIEDESIDVAFADPPFNLNKKYAKHKDNLAVQEYMDWCHQWLSEIVRVTKPEGSIFIHNIPKWLSAYSCMLDDMAHFRHWIVWDSPTSPMGKSLQPGHYGILYYSKTPPPNNKFYEIRYPHKRCIRCQRLGKDYGGKKHTIQPFGPLLSDVWTDIHRIKHNKYRDNHPCQLPIHLLERVVLMSSDEGDVVLDPFLGTGTTAIAAKRLGRKYIGIELSQEYVDVAENRLKQEVTPSLLEGMWVSCFLKGIVTVRDIDCKSEAFQILFDWPKNDDERRQIDVVKVKLKKEYQNLVNELCK